MAKGVSGPDRSTDRKKRVPFDTSKTRNYAHKLKVQKAKTRFIEKAKVKKAYAKVKSSAGVHDSQTSTVSTKEDESNDEVEAGNHQQEEASTKSTQPTKLGSASQAKHSARSQEKIKQDQPIPAVRGSNRRSRQQVYGKGSQPKLGKQSKPLLEKVRSLMAGS